MPARLVDRTLYATRDIDVRFYTRAAANAFANLPQPVRGALLTTLVRRCAAHFHAPKQRRADIIAALTAAQVYA